MAYYYDETIDREELEGFCRQHCNSFGTGQSHERIIQGAGGEIGYDGFRDPRPGHSGPIYADRVWITDDRLNPQVKAVEFRDKEGKFACSYVGDNYQDIKESNEMDMDRKRAMGQEPSEQTQGNPQGGQTQSQTQNGQTQGGNNGGRQR